MSAKVVGADSYTGGVDKMGVGWVRWSMSISGMSISSIWVTSIESSIWVSSISISESVSGVSGISVVEVSWISISFSFTLAKEMMGIWVSSVSSIGYWGSVVVSVCSWCGNDGWGGKSLNFYFSWFSFNRFDNSGGSMWVGSISIGTVWKSSVSSPSSPSGISSISSVQEVGISFSLGFGISGSNESEKNNLK